MTHSLALGIALAGLASAAVVALGTWLASLARHDASLVDRTWSIMIAGAALTYYVLLGLPNSRGTLTLILVSAWALRLALFISSRNWGHGEDRRYRAIRERNQPHFEIKSLVLVFGLQAVLAWVVSAPLLAGMAAARPLNALDAVGAALAIFGIAFESVADDQMSRFRASPTQQGQVMDRGLWRYSRHPNYFGEACVWWGLGCMALAGAGWAGAWSIVSPLLMTVLLLRVSGVPLLERDLAARRPAYRDYIARTNAFVPGPPRRQESA